MGTFSKLRKWINRDDGRFYQIGNEDIGVLATIGALALVVALVLWQLHDKVGISGVWVISAAIVGLILFIAGHAPDRDGGDDPKSKPFQSER